MTITKEPPGCWHVTCDKCGERKELDTDPDDSIIEAVADVKAMGWRCNRPERQTFAGGKYIETYWTHDCVVCR